MPRLLLLAALLALLVTVFRMTGDEDPAGPPSAAGSTPTGYYLRDALVTEYGPDGKVRLEVAARAATEDPARKLIALESVRLDYFAVQGQRWQLTAARGEAEPGMSTVRLEGDVVMTGQRRNLPEPAVVRTERLTLDTRSQRVSTDAPVTLGFGEYVVAATGMKADLKAETLRLESGVNGRFLP